MSKNIQGQKVAKVIEKWELNEIGDKLERRWTSEDQQSQSLRELADYFNVQVLEEALAQEDFLPLEGESENLYRLLTDSDVGESDRLQARQRLLQNGIDPDTLEEDFISHQTLYRYLTNFREADYSEREKPVEELLKNTKQRSNRLTNRVKAVLRNDLSRLENKDEIQLGDFDVYVDVRVVCSDCGSSRDVKQILENGGCTCG